MEGRWNRLLEILRSGRYYEDISSNYVDTQTLIDLIISTAPRCRDTRPDRGSQHHLTPSEYHEELLEYQTTLFQTVHF